MEIEIPQVNNTQESTTYESDKNCIIIIGANGAGKSRFAAYIEKKDYEKDGKGANFLRISAQRILNFSNIIPLKSYEEAEETVQFGVSGNFDKGNNKWKQYEEGGAGWTTAVNNDYDDVLAALIAKKNLENQQIADLAMANKSLDEMRKKGRIINQLKKIWESVLPERDIDIDTKSESIMASVHEEGLESENFTRKEYNGQGMSDGERVCLYMICQVLCAPSHVYIIIDEPELHLHPSIMHRLWANLEKARPDCCFIYVTHDTDFATQHGDADIIWIKNFDGENWDYDILKGDNLPDSLLLSILGNRKNVLFIEGKENSWDYKLYSEVFEKFLVIPCGSCRNVIECVKAYRKSPYLHHLAVAGLVDRDYRTEEEVAGLAKEDVYCLKVAEVENLFLTPELLTYYQEEQALPKELLHSIQKNVLACFQNAINSQISSAVKAELQYHITVTDFLGKETNIGIIEQNLKANLAKAISQFWAEKNTRYKEIVKEKNYEDVLVYYNDKSLLYKVLREAVEEIKKKQMIVKLIRMHIMITEIIL